MQVEQHPLFPETLDERGVLIRQRHLAEGNAAGETRGQLAKTISLVRSDRKLQAIENKRRRIAGNPRIGRNQWIHDAHDVTYQVRFTTIRNG